MALVTSQQSALLQGMSSFWNRLFADQALLQNIYQGTGSLLGQVYLDLLETVLSASIFNVPVFHKELWQSIVFRQDQIVFIAGATPAQNRYGIQMTNNITNFQYLYNQIFSPSNILEFGLDFSFGITPSADGTSQTVYLWFYEDPFTSNNGGIINGVASNIVQIVPTVYQTGGDGIAGPLPSSGNPVNLFHSNSAHFNAYDVNHQLLLNTPYNQITGLYNIASVLSPTDVLLETVNDGYVNFTYTAGVNWSLQSPSSVPQISMWAPDCLIDNMYLANNFGSLVQTFQPSSESYKLMIQGIFQYFMLGPALARMEAALNVINGFPVAQSDDEVALSYVNGLLTTNANVYGPFNSGMPLRADIQAAVTATPPQPFPLQAFEPLSSAFTVEDYTTNPSWWWNIVIPQALLPDADTNRRTVTPDLYPSVCGEPGGDLTPLCGDPGLICGADEFWSNPPWISQTGAPITHDVPFIPTPGWPTSGYRPPLHHNYAYQIMERYLQYNMFSVVVADGVTLTYTSDEFQDIIVAGKPAYTYLYFINS